MMLYSGTNARKGMGVQVPLGIEIKPRRKARFFSLQGGLETEPRPEQVRG